jgi:hypothetical protein
MCAEQGKWQPRLQCFEDEHVVASKYCETRNAREVWNEDVGVSEDDPKADQAYQQNGCQQLPNQCCSNAKLSFVQPLLYESQFCNIHHSSTETQTELEQDQRVYNIQRWHNMQL